MKITIGLVISLLITPLIALAAQNYTPPAICNYTYDYQDPYSKQSSVRMVWVQTTPRGLNGYVIFPQNAAYWQNGLCNGSLSNCTWKMVSKNNGNVARNGVYACPQPQQLYCDSTGNVAGHDLQGGWVANPEFPCNAGTSTFNFFSVKAQNS